jgi:aspartate aminotransferase
MSAVSQMAQTLIGSEVLRIAAEINAIKASGRKVLNFTVGDFDPAYFPIPEGLKSRIQEALAQGQTNYPPSSGVMALRESVSRFYNRELGLHTKASQILVAGGARPLIYSIFTTLLDPGDTVIYPVPSWNNNHYTHLARAKGAPIICSRENGFLPTAREIAPLAGEARLLCLNSPLNPTGTAFTKPALSEICALVIGENKKRKAAGARPLYVMYDQIYWMNTHGGAKHYNPVELAPEMEPYTLFVDGISKYFCSTGLRVGWSLIPESLMGTFSSVLGHIGAWAPKPEQVATAQFIDDTRAVKNFVNETNKKLESRLLPLFEGVQKLKAEGLPIDAVKPEGAIYLSLHLPSRNGASNEQTRHALLQEASVAVVPFQAFGLKEESGWFRMSVGAVAQEEIAPTVEALKSFVLKRR